MILQVFGNTIWVSGLTAVIGAVLGAVTSYALIGANPTGLLRTMVDSASSVLAQFGGIMLAFAFIATMGASSLLTVTLREQFDIDIYADGVWLYETPGLILPYIYFQVPLMIIVFLPALEALRPQWTEANATLGGTRADYWMRIGFPVLAPSFIGSLLLLFANAFSSYATAAALISQGSQIVPLQIRAALTSETVLGRANLAGSLALGMVIVMVVVMSLYALWMRTPEPSVGAIEKALQGNLCRCTGYEAIVKAALAISNYGIAENDPLAGERESVSAKLREIRQGGRVEIGTGKERFVIPATVDDLAAVLDAEPKATIVAGSTDVGLWVTKFMRDIAPVVFIAHLDELRTVTERDGTITIGACVSYTDAFAALSSHIPALGRLIDRIGGDQVRNMGTIGGNVANGSPIGDMPPPLIALGASLTLRKGSARRTIPLEDFFIAYGKQDRQPGEFVEAVHVPLPAENTFFAAHKVTKRRDEDITAALGAFHLLVEDGTVRSARIAYGGMAATPKRAKAVEAALVGKAWTLETIEAAMEEYSTDFAPISDMRASAEYRMLAAKNLLKRFFLETTGAAHVTVSRERAA